ncbi:tRNA1(Val) (adenine(37)-N6)-methyltransferase [Melittangium boletus]|uniref:tRNA1(Val) (adenine(37)-N6)-methyltransferase n=1 Tax=Melittangium boletus TaxID=83453 RepID=UPI001FEACB44|nr:methyltransferase [Melittangium boletus]
MGLSLELRPGVGETLDSVCGGQVRVLQRIRGYRFTLDPVLLAHFAVFEAGAVRGRVMDLGTGCGIIPLILARRLGLGGLTGLELQPGLFSLAERNVRLNRCEREVSLVRGDLRGVERLFPRGGFSHVLCNPPYRSRAQGRSSTDLEKALARHELTCSLGDVVRSAAYLLRCRGTFCVVYPASRLSELMAVLRAERLEPRTARLVHSRGGRPAKLVLMQAVKGAPSGLTVLPPLVIHANDEQAFSREVSAMVE